jgi:hypothetical protein
MRIKCVQTCFAFHTSRTGIPAMIESGSSWAEQLTVSLAPNTWSTKSYIIKNCWIKCSTMKNCWTKSYIRKNCRTKCSIRKNCRTKCSIKKNKVFYYENCRTICIMKICRTKSCLGKPLNKMFFNETHLMSSLIMLSFGLCDQIDPSPKWLFLR